MTLRLVRERSEALTTLGVLFLDDRFRCFTLEDQLREVYGRPVPSWKVIKETAIPAGKYRLAWTFSARFNKMTLQLLNVPGFEGIRMHAGNRREDTEGCILAGLQRAGVAYIKESAIALKQIEDVVVPELDAGRLVEMLVENPLGYKGE